ncbi:MAG: ribonuclease J [Rhodovibrionaceae bacterium]
MNLNLYGHAGKWLMIDLGVTFGEENLPGIEVVMPDPSFIVERKEDLVGLVLTHAHEDHLGAVPYLWDKLRCPIYATPFTAALLRRKLADDGIQEEVPITVVEMSGSFTLGPFEIELVTLTHSIPEPNALIIRTPCGTVLHTGDWKLDDDPLVGETYDEARLRRLADEGVLAMVCDSTNAVVPGLSGSELDVREGLQKVLPRFKNRVAVACFASNVARLETVIRVAEACGRRVSLVGRSMHRIHAAARESGYLQDLPPLVDVREVEYLPKEEILLLCTGSQGERRAALWRIAHDAHPEVVLEAGDAVIFSSRVIPGNEKDIAALYNSLAKLEIEVVTDETVRGEGHSIHVSGHPARDELAQMYQWVRPQIAIPVHGEARHLEAHAKLALECQVPMTVVPENGSLIRLAPGKPQIVDHVPHGRLAVDGNRLLPIDSPILRARRKQILAGSAVISLVVDAAGELLADAKLSAVDLLDLQADRNIVDELLDDIEAAHERLRPKARRDDEAVAEAVRIATRRGFNRLIGKKPIVEVQVIRVD